MSRVLVTGANGQLGQCFKHLEHEFDVELVFASRDELDITKPNSIDKALKDKKYDYLINCAAYTAVDRAEEELDLAQLINVDAVDYLANSCKEYSVHLIQISTDFVFDGEKNSPYLPTDAKNPKSVYGKTKSEGEELIQKSGAIYTIIRASWLYSNFANNFYRTILRLAESKDEISVVNDQIGIPDSAEELAKQLLLLLETNNIPKGILHFAHSGSCSWMEFAQKIVELNHLKLKIKPISTEAYGAAAKRPVYSVMEQSSCFEQIHWEKALKDVVLTKKQ